MTTFKEFSDAIKLAAKDKTSGKRMGEIVRAFRNTGVLRGPTPAKAVACAEELGPTFIKIGQIASNRSDMLTPEYCEALSKLRAHVPPMPFETVLERIESSYGHPWQDVFSEIDPKPLGSASIAQVHRAKLHDGTVVAVKVRRPNIDETMAADIMLMRRVISTAQFLTPANQMLDTTAGLIDELEATTNDELNFRVELGNLVRFRKDMEKQEGVTSPMPYPEFSTSEILVMEFVEGIAINDKIEAQKRGYNLAALGEKLVESYVTQVVDTGFFHADPHPGNIEIRDGELVWIDLGMTGKLTESQRNQVGRIFVAIATNNIFDLKSALLSMCMVEGDVDHGRLLQDVDQLMARYGSVSVEDLNVGQAFVDLTNLLRQHNIGLPSAFTMLGRGFLTIEGVVSEIAPQVSLVETITRHVKEQMSCLENAKEKARMLAMSTAASMESLTQLPKQATNALDMLQKGQVKVGMEASMTEKLRGDLHTLVGRLSLALLSAALLMGSSQLVSAGVGAGSVQLRAAGDFWGFIGFILAIYVFASIINNRHQIRNHKNIK